VTSAACNRDALALTARKLGHAPVEKLGELHHFGDRGDLAVDGLRIELLERQPEFDVAPTLRCGNSALVLPHEARCRVLCTGKASRSRPRERMVPLSGVQAPR